MENALESIEKQAAFVNANAPKNSCFFLKCDFDI